MVQQAETRTMAAQPPSKCLPHASLPAAPLTAAHGCRFFRDAKDGRTALLRGVNLSGASKCPARPHIPSHEPRAFFDHRAVSFVGRPFPLDDADQHLARLRSWGFNFLRFNTTWEALEHAGPGIYDHEYIAYVIQILFKAKEYGFKVFIDPHQDVWSRFSGGSGAPGWTLELAGFELRNFAPTNAAIVHNTYPDPKHYPKMIWPTNYYKLAAATMFTLLFAGKIFAPNCMVDDGRTHIQDYLQDHYAGAIASLARAIHETPGLEDDVVVGYDTLNEPGSGFIGCTDIRELMHAQELRNGLTPTPLQTMILGEGHAVDAVQVWDMGSFGPQRIGSQSIDPAGIRAWRTGASCVWAAHGVWDPATQTALAPAYFSTNPATGEPVEFLRDGWMPFVRRFSAVIREIHTTAVLFVEPPVNALIPEWDTHTDPSGPLCFTPHWYDGLTLVNKHFSTWYNVDYLGYLRGKYSSIAFAIRFGEAGIRSAFKSQLKLLRVEGQERLGDYPCVLGEIGIPFDLDDKHAYLTQDYSAQIKAMDANLMALERNLLNFTLWNYCPDNSNLWGDQWNGEDLSIWSPPVAELVTKEILLKDVENSVGSGSVTAISTAASVAVATTKTTNGVAASDHSGNGTLTLSTHSDKKDASLASVSAASSRGIPSDLNAGGRALEAFVRPYPVLTPGTPISLEFDITTTLFSFTFSHDIELDASLANGGLVGGRRGVWRLGSTLSDTGSNMSLQSPFVEIYFPYVHYPVGSVVQIWVSDGTWRVYGDAQRLIWRCSCPTTDACVDSSSAGIHGNGVGHDAAASGSGAKPSTPHEHVTTHFAIRDESFVSPVSGGGETTDSGTATSSARVNGRGGAGGSRGNGNGVVNRRAAGVDSAADGAVIPLGEASTVSSHNASADGSKKTNGTAAHASSTTTGGRVGPTRHSIQHTIRFRVVNASNATSDGADLVPPGVLASNAVVPTFKVPGGTLTTTDTSAGPDMVTGPTHDTSIHTIPPPISSSTTSRDITHVQVRASDDDDDMTVCPQCSIM